MLRLPKKKSEAAAAPTMPAWHPNFRNFERLPDTKVVRTAFFINGVAIVVAVVLLFWFGYQEYQLRELNRQVADWQAQIDHNRPGSDQAIAMFKQFEAAAARFGEIDAFVKSKPAVSALLLRLGETLPHNVALDTFDLGTRGLRLLVTVRGAPDQASGYASTYLDQLRADAVLKETFDTVTLNSLNRNPQTGRLSVEFFLKFKSVTIKKP